MTDDEINRAVAKIEGWWFDGVCWKSASHAPFTLDSAPPYTTDWVWCGPLLERYEIEITRDAHEAGDGRIVWRATAEGFRYQETYPTLPLAVCHAIIVRAEWYAAHPRPIA